VVLLGWLLQLEPAGLLLLPSLLLLLLLLPFLHEELATLARTG
jgi:hypothetical protein